MAYTQHAPEHRATVNDPPGAERTAELVLAAAVVAMGLLAGLIYDWAITVMPALTAAEDRTLVDGGLLRPPGGAGCLTPGDVRRPGWPSRSRCRRRPRRVRSR